MGTHMVAWFESIDQAALGRLAALQDDVLTPSDTDRFLVPDEYNHIHWAFATGVNISQARHLADRRRGRFADHQPTGNLDTETPY